MANIFFNIKVLYPGITDDIRISVYNTIDLNTPIASIQQNAPHIDQQFSFPGLPRQNFVYKVFQVETNGTTIISQLGHASFVATNEELTQKAPVLIQIGVDNIPGTTTLWAAGTSTVTIPDFIGEQFQIYGRPGQFPIKDDGIKHVDSQFNSATGKLDLLQIGDQFADTEYWYFSFLPVISQSSGGVGGGGTSTSGFSEILLVTANTTLATADIGKKILIAPTGDYIEITLPDYTSVSANIITYFEMIASASKCARIKTFSGQTIAWLETLSDLYICPNESFELYKRVVSTGTYQWRIQNACGNFLTAGEFVWQDMDSTHVFNMVQATGVNCNYQKYARLYNRRAIRDGVTYAAWNSANIFTRIKFSLKDTVSDNFHVPDFSTTPIYLRPAGGGSVAGDYVAQQLAQHQHMESIGQLPVPPFGQTGSTQKGTIGNYNGVGNVEYDLTSRAVEFSSALGLWIVIDGIENRPNSRVSNLYIKV